MLRKLLITGAMALTMVSLASASTVVSYTTNLNSVKTDIVDTTLAMQKFDPTLLSVPVGFTAVLKSFTVTLNQTISTSNMTIQNTGTGTSIIDAEVSSRGYLYLFNPTPISNLPINPLNLPTDDAFFGAGPKPTYNKTLSLLQGASAGPFSLTDTVSKTTGSYTDNASLVLAQSAWNVYIDTFTKLSISATGSGNGTALFDNFVNGSVTVNYTYDLESGVPEPATMSLMGVALLGLGLARKKFRS